MERTDGRMEERKDGITLFLPSEYVPAEQNLETIGYFSAGYKRKYPNDKQRSKIVTLSHDRRVEIIPTAKYGYPNCEDLDFYRAFQKICYERTVLVKREKEGKTTLHPHLKLPIGFHYREIIRKAGRVWSNRDLQSARDWIGRSTSTMIQGELYHAKTKGFDSAFGGSLFSQFVLVGHKMRSGQIAGMNYIWPAPWFLSNYYYHYFHHVDLAFHRRLHMAIAKTLYPILDTGWYAAQGQPYMKRYTNLCAILSIPAYEDLSRVKQQLDPSHEELRREGFLAAWEYLLDQHGRWTGIIRWWPGPKWFHDQEERKLRKELAGRIDRSPIILVVPDLPKEAKALPCRPSPSPASPANSSCCDPPRLPETKPAQDWQAELAHNFYVQVLGQPQVSRENVEEGAKIISGLVNQGFSREKIEVGIGWIQRHPERFDGEVYSLRLLPKVMGQALKEDEVLKRAQEKKRQQDGQERRLREGLTRHVALEELYLSLPAAEQASLWEKAQENLIQQGIQKAFLVEALVRNEVYQMLGERGQSLGRNPR